MYCIITTFLNPLHLVILFNVSFEKNLKRGMNYLQGMRDQNTSFIKNVLKSKIRAIITIDLTVGRKDDYLNPLSQDKIDKFIEENNDNIEIVIQKMMHAYFCMFDEFDLIKNPPSLTWIREYLYEHVSTQIEQQVNEMEQMD